MTVCPCCGFKFEGDLREGCQGCGARAVGEPLSRPLKELPFYGRALLVSTVGAATLITFLVSTIAALLENHPVKLDFWSWVSAAETAAWQLKWIALPVSALALWGGALLCASIRRAPLRFAGLRAAEGGLAASALVALMIAVFIGATIPERLRKRERGMEAGIYSQGYTIQRALLEYRERYGTLPATLDELKLGLPDRDGSIAAALANIDSTAYSPGADIASLPKKKARNLRGSALRNASMRSTDDGPAGGLAFTKYEMRLPGQDKKLGTEDDWVIRNGVVSRPSEIAQQPATSDAKMP
ncbi:MAG TPA: hypothetical protein VF723_17135 [Pyrinomonadaceae bacterium]